jgi:hypothetical protein
MPDHKKIFQWRTETGDPITIQGDGDPCLEVIPQARTLIIRWPSGGLVWNRPAAVLMKHSETSDAPPTRVPIVDVTRIAQGVLLSLSIIFTVISVIVSIKPRREHNG